MKTYKMIIVTALIMMFASTISLAQRLHPKVKEKKIEIKRVVLLRPIVSLTMSGLKGQEPLAKEAEDSVPVFEKAVAKVFSDKQIIITPSPFTQEYLEQNQDTRYAIADLQKKYNDTLPLILKKQKDVEKGRFSLGDEVLKLNQDDSIDAFIFINAIGQKKSKGMKTLGIIALSPLMVFPTYLINVSVVDARTGDILAFSQTFTAFDVTKPDNEKFDKFMKYRWKKFQSGK